MKSRPMTKSSVAVFSNQGDPFPTQARGRTHYHPSQAQALSKDQTQMVLSPERLRLPPHLPETLSPPDLSFLGGSQRLLPANPESDSSGPFDESWPSSEGSSKTPEQDGRSGARTTEPPGGSQSAEDSVIAKYIARFRHGQPSSRMERSPPQPSGKDFWWLQVSPDSPDTQRHRPSSGVSGPPGFSPQSLDRTSLMGENSDVDVSGLQDRAGKLILRSQSSLSSGEAVSSEGLGSSPFSGISNSESDSARTRPPTLDTAPVVPVLRPPATLPVPSIQSHPTLAPEDDILYQWRLRRKMEQAREGTLPVTTRRRSPSPPIRIPRQVYAAVDSSEVVCPVQPPEAVLSSRVPAQQESTTSYLSGFPLASPSLAPHPPSCTVPPHLHLLCDILRCAHGQQASPCPVPTQKEQVQPVDLPKPEATSWPPKERREKAPRRAGRAQESKAAAASTTKRKEKTKSGDGIPAKAVEASVPQSQVTRALEQVISERLFSPLSPPQPKSSIRQRRPITPPTGEDEELQPVQIAAHLLEEAEESDGTEFADDPLLQVLREQRQSLRSRIRAVDVRLQELEERELPSHPL